MTIDDDRYREPMVDPYSWKMDIIDEPAPGEGSMRTFDATTEPMVEGRSGPRVICRGETLAVYSRTFGDGKGEIPIHSHDDESSWFVVTGAARFFDNKNEEIASLKAGQGIFIPPGARYRFECVGPETMLLRIASRQPEASD